MHTVLKEYPQRSVFFSKFEYFLILQLQLLSAYKTTVKKSQRREEKTKSYSEFYEKLIFKSYLICSFKVCHDHLDFISPGRTREQKCCYHMKNACYMSSCFVQLQHSYKQYIYFFLKDTVKTEWLSFWLVKSSWVSALDWFASLQIFCLFPFSSEVACWYLSIFIRSYSQTFCRRAVSPFLAIKVLQKDYYGEVRGYSSSDNYLYMCTTCILLFQCA